MADQELLSVAQAAETLGVSVPRVRQLLSTGALVGREVGRHVLVDADSVRRRAAGPPPAGRPAGPRLAWAALAALSADRSASATAVKDRQLRHRLAKLLAERRGVDEWAALMRRRAVRRRYWAHPAVVRDLLADPAVSPGRALAASLHGLDVSPGDDAVAYVAAADLTALERRYALEPDPRGGVELLVYPPDAAPFAPMPGQPVPLAAAALDMADSDDSRMRALARSWFDQVNRTSESSEASR